METWRLLVDGPGAPAWNMAVDEALLRLAMDGAPPVLRIYEWDISAVSLGYFQPAALAGTRPFIRRYTGGGLVDHARDVTYTVAAPRAHPLGQMSTAESYSKIHEGVAAALRALGIEAVLSPDCGEGNGDACFRKAVKFDVLHAGAKVAGAAQRRTRSGLLQQGSILLPDPAFNPALRVALPAALGALLGFTARPDALTEEETILARELERERYGTEAWNRQH
jgi:lipoate-protein ligase A